MTNPSYRILPVALRPGHGIERGQPVTAAPVPYVRYQGQSPRRRLPSALVALIPGAVALAMMLWGIDSPSLWRDEAATLSAVQRSFPDLIAMLRHVDAVHGAYYMFLWVVVRAAGPGEFALRFPSALAMAASAVLITLIGRRLLSPGAGLASGLTLAAIPAVSWFGQDARPFAIETALACGATWLLVRGLTAPGTPQRRRALWGYGATLIALGLANVFGLLIIPAHALTLAWQRDRARPVWRGWLLAVAVTGVLMAPLAAIAWRQRGQIGWLTRPGLAQVAELGRLIGGSGADIAVLAILAGAVALGALAGRAHLARDWPGSLLAVSLPWLILPPLTLFAASMVEPVYIFRYIVFCIPAAALLTGSALAALGPATGSTALVLVMVLGLPAQVGERGPAGHGDGIRWADRILAGRELPGDAVLYLGGPGMRTFALAYPYGLAKLRDISLGRTAAQSGTIAGTDADLVTVRGRLADVARVWVAQAGANPSADVAALRGMPFRIAGTWRVSDISLALYVRETALAVTAAARGPLPGYPAVPLSRH